MFLFRQCTTGAYLVFNDVDILSHLRAFYF